MELNHGYCDIFLMPDLGRYPAIGHSYILELKVLKTSDNDDRAKEQWDEAVRQVQHYAQGRKVQLMTQGTQLHLVVLQIKGTQCLRLGEARVNNE